MARYSKQFWTVAFYEADRAYGGPEEGGWWYDCGTLLKVYRSVRDMDKAHELARRANRHLARQREYMLAQGQLPIYSVNYSGGHIVARVYGGNAPEYYPEERPYYE